MAHAQALVGTSWDNFIPVGIMKELTNAFSCFVTITVELSKKALFKLWNLWQHQTHYHSVYTQNIGFQTSKSVSTSRGDAANVYWTHKQYEAMRWSGTHDEFNVKDGIVKDSGGFILREVVCNDGVSSREREISDGWKHLLLQKNHAGYLCEPPESSWSIVSQLLAGESTRMISTFCGGQWAISRIQLQAFLL